MAGLRDLLARFRPAGTPGGAARPGVPADRVAELAAELEPVLALLAGVQAEAERIRGEGSERAGALRRQAREQAEVVLADARARAQAARAETVARAGAAAEEESARVAMETERATRQLRERIEARLPACVDRAVAAALEELR